MEIPTKKILLFLLICAIIILVLHFLIVYSRHILDINIHPFLFGRFDIDNEGNIPTWFSSSLLFSIGITSLVVAFLENQKPQNPKSIQIFWYVFGIVYIFFSFDEGAQIHELIDQLSDIKWVFIYAPFAFSFLIYCLYHLILKKHESTVIRNYIILGLGIYFLGGLFAEYASYKLNLSPINQQIEFFLEEGFEMLGTIIVLQGPLHKLNSIFSKLASSNSQ